MPDHPPRRARDAYERRLLLRLLAVPWAEVLDLFAGPGGWEVAAHALGLRPLGVEWDADACATRLAEELWTLMADVAELDPELFEAIKGLIGSPPCPTFSAAGGGAGRLLTDVIVQAMRDLAGGRDTRETARAEARKVLEPVAWAAEQKRATKQKRVPDRAKADAQARRDAHMSVLVVEPLRFAVALRPEWIALEQVPAVEPLWRVMAQLLEPLGYSTWVGVLEAERYGVPQTRRRAVLIASRVKPVHGPEPTHHRYVPNKPRPDREEGLFGTIEPWVSMAEALGHGMTHRPSVSVLAKVGGSGGRRPLEGGSGARAALQRERDAGRWAWADRPAPTVTGGGGATGGAEPFGNGARQGLKRFREDWIHARPSVNGDPRIAAPGRHDPEVSGSQYGEGTVRVTVEEAAALQTFPPGYRWRGTRTAQFTQVGNAVPPLLALPVLEVVV